MLQILRNDSGIIASFTCDHCHKPIKDAGLALALWKVQSYWEDSINPKLIENGKMYTLHKGCADQFEAENNAPAHQWPWVEMVDMILMLVHSSGLTMEKLQQRAETRTNMTYRFD